MKFIHKLMLASKSKIVLSSIGVLALVLFTSLIVFDATKNEVTVVADGEEQIVQTHTSTVQELFSELGITIGAHDELSHQQDAPIENGMTINYQQAKQVTVTIDGESDHYYTTKETILAFFKEQQLSFTDEDELSHSLDEAIEDGLEINVKQAFKVTVNDGGKQSTVATTGGTVADLLKKHNVEINEKVDKVKPALDEEVTKDTVVDIIRVTTETITEEEAIQYVTEKEEDSTLLKGKERVIKQGQNGQVVKKYKVTKENGEEISRELIEEEVTQESKNRVIAVGTKEASQQANSGSNLTTLSNTSSNAPSGGKSVTVTASAFTATCGGCSGVTATGINLKANPNQKVIAVDPNVIPLGSRVWVEGYGEAIAGDTGSSIRGNRIDVHVPNNQAAHQWGVRKVKVKILD